MKGNRQPSTLKAAILLAIGLGLSKLAMAVGLGPIQVDSYMGQPLKASIKINGISDTAAAASIVQLADTAAYRARGIVKTAEQSSLTFSIVKSGNGHTILVRSNAQIREPFINFILSMKSGGQEITREYAVFLNPDPAVQAGIAPAPTSLVENKHATVIQPANADTRGWGGKTDSAKPVALTPQTNSYTAAETATLHASNYQGGNVYGPVKPGETLYSIAKVTRPSEAVSIDAMMRAIFKANRRAFASNSLSSLMVGYTLTIPSVNGTQPTATPVEKTERPTKAGTTKTTVAEARKKNNKSSQPETPVENSSNEDTVAEHSEIAPVLNTDNTNQESSIIPTEMSEEEIAAAKAEAEAKHSETNPTEETTHSESTVGMQLDTPDSLDTTPPTESAEASQSSTENKALTIEPEVSPSVNNTPVVASSSESQSTPTTIEPVKPIIAPTADTPSTDNNLPFGLPLWQLLLIGVGGIILLLLLVFALLAKRRKKHSAELTEEELDALTKELETSAEGKLLASALSDEVIIEKPTSHHTRELPLENEYAKVDDFFSEEETSNEDTTFQELDDFFTAADEQTYESPVIDTHQQQSFDDLDDFFAETPETQEKSSAEPVEIDGLEDFFSVSANEKAENSVYSEEAAPKAQYSDFDALDDFFAEAADETKDNASSTLTSTEAHASSFDDLDDFFAVSDEKTISADSARETSNQQQQSSDFNELDDFFTKVESASQAPASHTEPEFMDFEEDFFIELEEEPKQSVSTLDNIDNFFDDNSSTNTDIDTKDAHAPLSSANIPHELILTDDKVPSGSIPEIQEKNPSEETSSKASIELSPADIQAMDINLDLASAYIKSGVKPEKARMWLNEVLEKGTEEQRKVAQDLLKKLD